MVGAPSRVAVAEWPAVEDGLHRAVAAPRRRVTRHLAVLVARLRVGAALEQRLHHAGARMCSRGVERRATTVVAAAHLDALLLQQPLRRVEPA
eukprot:6920020-Prymnesium_polylepis.1